MAKRSRAQFGTLSTILAISFITGLILSGSVSFVSASTSAGISQQFSGLNPLLKVQQLQTQLRNAEEQTEAAKEVLTRYLPPNGFDIYPQIRGFLQEYQHVSGEETLDLVGTSDVFPAEFAELLSGEWPAESASVGSVATESASVEVALAEETAELLGVTVGDELAVIGSSNEFFTVISGIYQPLAGDSGYWAVSSAVANGSSEIENYPVVYSPENFAEHFESASFRLNLLANPDSLDANAVDQIVRNFPPVQNLLRVNDGFTGGKGMSSGGNVLDTLNSVQDALVSVRAVTPVPILLIVMLSLIGLSQLSVLLNTARQSETVLHKSRGMSIAKLGRYNFFEAAVFTFPVAVIGALLAIPVIALISGGIWVHWLEPLIIGVLVGLLSSFVVWVVARAELMKPLNRESVHDSGRVKAALQASLVVLVLIAAAFSLWQFKLHGSAVIVTASGDIVLDWVSLLAPVLLILSFTLVMLLFVGPLSRIFAKQKHKFVTGYLSTVQVSRRITIFTVSFSLVALATASIVFAAGYAGSWQDINARQQESVNPSGVKFVIPQMNLRPVTDFSGVEKYVDNPGVSGIVGLNQFVATALEQQFELLVVPPDLASVLPVAESNDGRAELSEFAQNGTRSDSQSGIVIPAGTQALNLDLTSSKTVELYEQYVGSFWSYPTGEFENPVPAQTQFVLYLSDGQGGILTVVENIRADSIRADFEITLPEPEKSWQLIGLNIVQSTDQDYGIFLIDWHGINLESATGSTEVSLPSNFVEDSVYLVEREGGSAGLKRNYVSGQVDDSLPALAAQGILDRLGLEIGDEIELQLLGNNRKYTVEITAVAPNVPGTSNALALAVPIVDFQFLTVKQDLPLMLSNQYWLSLDDPSAIPDWLSAWHNRVLDSDLQLGSRTNPLVYASVVTGWFGAAGIVILALTALVAVTTVLSATRRPEIPVFRALGLSAKMQASIRKREMFLVTALALVSGAIIGLLASWLTVPEMALSTIVNRPDGLSPTLQFDFVTGAIFLLVLLAGLAIIIWRYARVIRRQALDMQWREETR